METKGKTSKFGRWLRILVVLTLWMVAGVAVVLAGAHFIWKYSGSGEWELMEHEGDIRIYEMKLPGSTLKRFRAVKQMEGTTSAAVAAMLDTDISACTEWFPGCRISEAVEPWDPVSQRQTYFWHVDVGSPLSPREFLLKIQATPEPADGSVLVEFMAMPDMRPLNECCFRVTDMHNSWRFTPVGRGMIEVEFIQNMDVGVPYFLINASGPAGIRSVFAKLPGLLSKEKYTSQRLDFVEDMNQLQ